MHRGVCGGVHSVWSCVEVHRDGWRSVRMHCGVWKHMEGTKDA